MIYMICLVTVIAVIIWVLDLQWIYTGLLRMLFPGDTMPEYNRELLILTNKGTPPPKTAPNQAPQRKKPDGKPDPKPEPKPKPQNPDRVPHPRTESELKSMDDRRQLLARTMSSTVDYGVINDEETYEIYQGMHDLRAAIRQAKKQSAIVSIAGIKWQHAQKLEKEAFEARERFKNKMQSIEHHIGIYEGKINKLNQKIQEITLNLMKNLNSESLTILKSKLEEIDLLREDKEVIKESVQGYRKVMRKVQIEMWKWEKTFLYWAMMETEKGEEFAKEHELLRKTKLAYRTVVVDFTRNSKYGPVYVKEIHRREKKLEEESDPPRRHSRK